FAQQLAYNATPACAERGTNSNFAGSRSGAREKQVREVGAGDDEHEPDRAQKHQEGRANVADNQALKREQVNLPSGIFRWKLLCETLPDHVELRLGLGDRNTRLEPPGREQPMPGSEVHKGLKQRILSHGYPNLARAGDQGKAEV